MRPLRRLLLVLGGVAAVALVVAASAIAYWKATGSGFTTSATPTVLAVTLTGGTPSAEVYPGGHADVAVAVSNPNPFAVHLGTLSLDAGSGSAGFGVDAGHGGCATAALSFTTQTNSGAGWSVPPKVGAVAGVLAIDLPSALAMDAGAAAACQGASFVVHLNVA